MDVHYFARVRRPISPGYRLRWTPWPRSFSTFREKGTPEVLGSMLVSGVKAGSSSFLLKPGLSPEGVPSSPSSSRWKAAR